MYRPTLNRELAPNPTAEALEADHALSTPGATLNALPGAVTLQADGLTPVVGGQADTVRDLTNQELHLAAEHAFSTITDRETIAQYKETLNNYVSAATKYERGIAKGFLEKIKLGLPTKKKVTQTAEAHDAKRLEVEDKLATVLSSAGYSPDQIKKALRTHDKLQAELIGSGMQAEAETRAGLKKTDYVGNTNELGRLSPKGLRERFLGSYIGSGVSGNLLKRAGVRIKKAGMLGVLGVPVGVVAGVMAAPVVGAVAGGAIGVVGASRFARAMLGAKVDSAVTSATLAHNRRINRQNAQNIAIDNNATVVRVDSVTGVYSEGVAESAKANTKRLGVRVGATMLLGALGYELVDAIKGNGFFGIGSKDNDGNGKSEKTGDSGKSSETSKKEAEAGLKSPEDKAKANPTDKDNSTGGTPAPDAEDTRKDNSAQPKGSEPDDNRQPRRVRSGEDHGAMAAAPQFLDVKPGGGFISTLDETNSLGLNAQQANDAYYAMEQHLRGTNGTYAGPNGDVRISAPGKFELPEAARKDLAKYLEKNGKTPKGSTNSNITNIEKSGHGDVVVNDPNGDVRINKSGSGDVYVNGKKVDLSDISVNQNPAPGSESTGGTPAPDTQVKNADLKQIVANNFDNLSPGQKEELLKYLTKNYGSSDTAAPEGNSKAPSLPRRPFESSILDQLGILPGAIQEQTQRAAEKSK